ncbi:helix-turn-helix domain-containing protein [Halomonas sp. HP20-15]|uniref:helix-turn-helix domain-containing protein n=1 Tax=Halomonas sp. HP20-15 TaxID=3085901 RepID=UPI002982A418|nr:helix-turn-helix domain-containing protein [Halomonas sp. HP20-15]MDW5376690.1 helix-turn-helix domain-containing protein [Halomonas sp. HP20-15]
MAQDRVEAVERALTILDAFDSPQERFSLADLAGVTGFYKSTLLRLLGSLERYDYVQRGSDGRYQLGHSPVRLARRHPPGRQLAAWIQPALDALAEHSGETAALLEVAAGRAECLLVAVPSVALRHELRPGERWPLSDPRSPALDFAGGVMVCRALDTAREPRALWLSLSGPTGRLQPPQAEAQLVAALGELTRGPDSRQAAVSEAR